MRLITFFTILFFVLSSSLDGQTQRAFIKAGDDALKNRAYYNAMHYYEKALEFKKVKTDLYYKYAEAARLFEAYDISTLYYKKVLADKGAKRKQPLAMYRLGEVLKGRGKYDKAVYYFELFVQTTKNKVFVKKAKEEIQKCLVNSEIVADSNLVEIKHLDKTVNTRYSEFGAVPFNDELYYSTYKYKNSSLYSTPRPKVEAQILKQKGSARGKPLKQGFNTKGELVANTSFVDPNQKIYYTICAHDNTGKLLCDIYSRKKKNSRKWDEPVKLPEPINIEGATNTQPHLTKHPDTGNDALFFVSDRSGGKGGLDIYLVEIKGDQYGMIENISINTAKDDVTPFYQTSTQTLFFSSKGYDGLGGFDVFKTRWSPELQKWSMHKNIGYPENSSYDDNYYVINSDSTQAYLSSNREGSFYFDDKRKNCCSDIYSLEMPIKDTSFDTFETLESIDSLLVEDKGTKVIEPLVLKDKIQKEIIVEHIPTTRITSPKEENLELFSGLELYFDNDYPGPRSWSDTTAVNYQDLHLKYKEQKEVYKKALSGINETDEISQFFDEEVELGGRNLSGFCDELLKSLEEGERYELTLTGFASPRSTSSYNLQLSKRRVVSVYNSFLEYRNGVLQKYLYNNQLVIYRNYVGEVQNRFYHAEEIGDLEHSIYHINAAKSRKVTIKKNRSQ